MGSTLKDVAKLAGVSMSTVSRVVNQNGYVSPEIVAKVEQAVKVLDYRPNDVARSFRKQRTLTIGVIVPDIADLYYMEVCRGVEEAVRPHGYFLLLASTKDDTKIEEEYCRLFVQRHVDGVILATAGLELERVRRSFSGALPVVLVDREIGHQHFDCVLDDNLLGMDMLIDFLVQQGHQNIGLVNGSPRITAGVERRLGFEKSMVQRGLKVRAQWIWQGEFSSSYGFEAAMQIAKAVELPSAVVAANNRLAVGLLRGLKEAQVAVPEDLSMVVYGDSPESDVLYAPLTVVKQPARDIGHAAGQRLLQRIAGDESPCQEVRLAPVLHIRKSVRSVAKSNRTTVK